MKTASLLGLMLVASGPIFVQGVEFIYPKGSESADPHGLFDFYRPEFADWAAVTDAQFATVIDDYKAIEDVISQAGLW